MIRVLGIFTCYNRMDKTAYCLQQLVKTNPGICFSFIAVDDNSTDGTQDFLKARNDILYIKGNGALYYSGGMRRGMAAARRQSTGSDYCLLFNDDVEFFDGSIEKLIRYADSGEQVLIGATCDTDGVLSYGGVMKGKGWKPSFPIVMSSPEKRVRCDTFNANCVLIPMDLFLKSETMDERFTHSLGDYDYGLSLKQQGGELLVSDFFVGVCCDNPKNGTWRDNKLAIKERIRKKETPKGLPFREWFYFIHKNYGFMRAVIFSVTPYIKILLRR